MSANSNRNLVELLKKVEREDPLNALLAELYKRHDEKSVDALVTDLRKDASHTLSWVTVDYDECVKLVAKKMGVRDNDLGDDETQNELLILQTTLTTYFDKLSPEERKDKIDAIQKEFGEQGKEVITAVLLGSSTTLLTFLQTAGPVVVQSVLVRIFATVLGVQAAAMAARFATLAIPFLNALMAAWLIFDIAGPAYRKIVPSVMNIALLRLTFSAKVAS